MKKKIVFNERKFMYRELEGDFALLNLKSGHYYTLSRVGRLLFRYILKGVTQDSLVKHLAQKYPQEGASRLEKDVDDFLKDLMKEGVVSLESD